MALFAIWYDESGLANLRHTALLQAAHIVPERVTAAEIATAAGRWQLAAFACTNHYYTAEAQVWIDRVGGACVIHGLIWRTSDGALLDARAVAALLDRPGARLAKDVAGEYAVARLYPDGTLEAFGDLAGLHQLFYPEDGRPILASRAAFAALLAEVRQTDPDSALWIGTIGYRVGLSSGWAGIRQLGQGARLVADRSASRIVREPLRLPQVRGFASGGADLIEEGLEQAKAALDLAAGDSPLDLPITGGKDSRAVLAIAVAAGLRDRLTLFTRGYAGHPDVVVGERIAARLGVPHRREPPLGSDLPPDLGPNAFMTQLRIIAFQTDGGMGGWDNVTGAAIGRQTLVSGHLGEVLKAYAKRMPHGPLDPAAMVRLQAPFDPMEVLHPQSRARLTDTLGKQMAEARAAGAEEADLPDLFYWRNRVPNWLGGIRGIKAFERQPVLPLGVPALMRLAFLMTAAERRAELAHYKLIEAAAPQLIDLPFAHQSWDASLGAAEIAPVLAAPGAALFGSWQWSVNRLAGVRAALANLFASIEIPLWEGVDRCRLIDALHQRRFDYFDLISLLGFAVAAIHQAGLALPAKMGGERPAPETEPAPPPVTGHVDLLRVEGDEVLVDGWSHAPEWPGAGVAVEARIDDRPVVVAAADRYRPDLAAAGIGDGRHAFALRFDASLLAGADRLVIAGVGNAEPLTGGARDLDEPLPGGD
jgi:hypothetical protein